MVKRDFELTRNEYLASLVQHSFSWVFSFLLLLQITLQAVEPPCIMCFQYNGGVQYIGGYHEYIGEYHEYIKECAVRRIP